MLADRLNRECFCTGLDDRRLTRALASEDGDALWSERRKLFFKPRDGFGSRAAYRGDKVTRRVWQQILAGDYVAQDLVAPGERAVDNGGELRPLKYDVRNFVYDGMVQWVSARLYQGQTTNFRTPGGGFAPIHRVPLLEPDERGWAPELSEDTTAAEPGERAPLAEPCEQVPARAT